MLKPNIYMAKKQELPYSKKKTIGTFYEPKQTTKDQKYHSETWDSMVFLWLKVYYPTVIMSFDDSIKSNFTPNYTT